MWYTLVGQEVHCILDGLMSRNQARVCSTEHGKANLQTGLCWK